MERACETREMILHCLSSPLLTWPPEPAVWTRQRLKVLTELLKPDVVIPTMEQAFFAMQQAECLTAEKVLGCHVAASRARALCMSQMQHRQVIMASAGTVGEASSKRTPSSEMNPDVAAYSLYA